MNYQEGYLHMLMKLLADMHNHFLSTLESEKIATKSHPKSPSVDNMDMFVPVLQLDKKP